MKKVMFTFLGVLILLGGCSSKTDAMYSDSMQKGLDAIAKGNFSKAEGLFEIALDAKKGDAKAKAYLNQVQLIEKADNLAKQNKIDDAVQTLDKSINVKDGAKEIASKSKEKEKALIQLQNNQKNYTALLTDAKNLNQSGDYQGSNNKLDELLKADLTQFVSIKDEATKLKGANTEAIKNAEIAQAKKEAEAKAAAQAQANDPMAWAPGIKDQVEKSIRDNGYIDPNDHFLYKNGYIGGDNQGYYGVYDLEKDQYIVTVNVKTGWYHG